MSNIIRKTTELAINIVSTYAYPGCIIVDATCGNGHDTLALINHQPSKLYAFDIQQEAVDATASLLKQHEYEAKLNDGTISIICDSHANMHEYIGENVDIVVFNLGYLPGGDKTKVTQKSETIIAMKTSLDLLSKDGILCITMYSGHPEGLEEKKSLLKMAEDLDPRVFHTAYISFPNQKNFPPEILLITKKV